MIIELITSALFFAMSVIITYPCVIGMLIVMWAISKILEVLNV